MSIEAMKQARKALHIGTIEDVIAARDALDQAIAEAEKQEPVAWMHWLHGPVRLFLNKDEAMMELDRLNREYPVDKDAREMRPLYTHPQPKREPLTDEQAQEVRIKAYSRDIDSDMALIRETEAAHGIKGEA